MKSHFSISYGSTQVGQFSLPGTEPDEAGALQRKAEAPLKPALVQEPCDVGMFSDASAQVDLSDLIDQHWKSVLKKESKQ